MQAQIYATLIRKPLEVLIDMAKYQGLPADALKAFNRHDQKMALAMVLSELPITDLKDEGGFWHGEFSELRTLRREISGILPSTSEEKVLASAA